MRVVVVLVPTPGFADKPAFLPRQTSFCACALRWSWCLPVVYLLMVAALADVHHAVAVEDLGTPETPLCLALRMVVELQKL